MNISQRELSSSVDSFHGLLKNFVRAGKCLQTPLQEPKIEIESTNSKDSLFAHYCNVVLEHSIRPIFYRSDSETAVVATFQSKSLNYTAINLFLQKLSTPTIAKFTTSTRTDITLQTNLK